MAFRAVTYLVTIDRERHDVLQVWRFEQLLTGTRTRLLARRVLQVWRSSSYLPVAMEPGPCIGFCRYGVSSSYLPPTRKWVRLRCFASMAFRAVTCPFEEADSCMSSFAGISSRAATYPPVFVICLNPDFESMAFRAATYRTGARDLVCLVLQVWRFEQLLALQAIGGCNMLFCRHRVSSSYLPIPTVGCESFCFAGMAFRVATCPSGNRGLQHVVSQAPRFE